MSWLEHKNFIQEEAIKFDKSIKVHDKNNFLGKLHNLLWKNFAFTLGNHHFYPESWSVDNVFNVLIHEARHTKQFRWLGFGIHPIVGLPFAAVLYLLFPLPVFFALGRFYMELDADRSKFRFLLENNLSSSQDVIFKARQRAGSLSRNPYCWALLTTL